ncbi:response regulator transcription factor [Mucilaginibacter myungsuensis]|uniref:Response regulator transcription factor n=1 Tax=Mucilaginibacter myungsuensis TaxID=649104 RepID=A0A929L3R5_9SPHI|nr:response regulator transcription factor [Mucilaginibacter myungsuensis]MBE9663929.1 response regulator transcription factor [Mucilaginibacter myungsuensis]MDN3598355.1 response regulator transcription factor [Mucilaginibacter myungsuensis]
MEIKVAIFEDNKLIREALQTIINGTPGFICTGTFANVNQVEADILFCRPDVVLMDIEMPGRNGIEATQIITDNFPDVKVLIQTVFNDNDKIFKALCAGASGYILKADSPLKLLQALEEVHKGGASMSSAIAQKVLQFFVRKNVILVQPEETDFALSAREKEILSLMMEGYNYRDLADKAFISYETVRTHIKRIYKKLHVASRSEAIMKAKQQGFV